MQVRSSRLVALVGLGALLTLSGCAQLELALGTPDDETLLQTVSLKERDAAPSAALEPYRNGDVVAGETSLDLCAGSFPSERLRIGRNQVAIGARATPTWVSSEAILYSSPDEAKQAMAELAAARRDCPDTPVEPRAGGSAATWTFTVDPDLGWPTHDGVTRQAYAFTLDSGEDTQSSGTAVYLQRGRMILALYSTPPGAPAGVLVNAPDAQRFTEVMTQRLLSLPEDALAEGDPSKRVDDPRDLDT